MRKSNKDRKERKRTKSDISKGMIEERNKVTSLVER